MLAELLHPEEKQTSHLFKTGGSFTNGNKVPTKIRLLSFNKNQEIGVLSPLMFAFQTDDSQVIK